MVPYKSFGILSDKDFSFVNLVSPFKYMLITKQFYCSMYIVINVGCLRTDCDKLATPSARQHPALIDVTILGTENYVDSYKTKDKY